MQLDRTRRQNFFIILILGVLNALTPFTIDLYLPAFPQIAHDLNVTVERVSLTVSMYFIGFALGQILYGPLLDRFGRKRPIYIGVSIYLLATLGCMTSHSIEALLFFRLLSALGGCVASVSTTAMVRDYFAPAEGAKVFSMLMLVLSASPLLAPTVGGFIIAFANWRVIFAVLFGLALIDLILVRFFLPTAYKPDPTISLKAKPILRNFMNVLKVRQFTVYTLAGSFSFAGLFVYVAGSPAIFMDTYHVSAQTYGLIFAILGVGMIGGGQLNLLLMRKYSNRQIFKAALLVQTVTAAIFFVGTITTGFAMVPTIAFLFVILSCAGISFPNAASLSLEPFTTNIGSASSLLGFLQLSAGSILSAAIGMFDIKGTLPTASVIAFSSLVAMGIVRLDRPKQN